jgi:hypothetical protein
MSLRSRPTGELIQTGSALRAGEPTGPAPPTRGRTALLLAGMRGFARRRRTAITVIGSLLTAGALVVGLAGRRHEFSTALSNVALPVLAGAALLQIVALLARTEAWHLSIDAAGGSVARRLLYRASSMQVLGSVLNGQLGVAARITALRRSSPTVTPQVPTLIAAEFPILAVEATLAALTSFTLVGPLGLSWSARRARGCGISRSARAASSGAASRCCAAFAAAVVSSRSSWSRCSRRSSATGCCCTPWASLRPSSTRSPC